MQATIVKHLTEELGRLNPEATLDPPLEVVEIFNNVRCRIVESSVLELESKIDNLNDENDELKIRRQELFDALEEIRHLAEADPKVSSDKVLLIIRRTL